MRIHTDHNGVAVNALSKTFFDEDVEGHLYQVMHGSSTTFIGFQTGAVAQNGVNGATNEAILAILIHRTKFLNAKFPCSENEIALNAMEIALEWLEHRTAQRLARGVEGKNIV